MEIREIDPRDEALVHRHWEIGKLAEGACRPYDFYAPWQSAWLNYAQERDDYRYVLLGAFDGDEMVGAGRVDLSLLDNLHSAFATVYVAPGRERRGVGRTIDSSCVEVARAQGRRVLMTETYAPPTAESAGLLFAKAMGYTQGLVDGMKVVDLAETEPTWDALAERAAPRHEHYRIVTWLDHVPEEHIEDYCRLNALFFDEAPMGELDVEPERWDAARVRNREERNARSGRRDVSAGAVAPDGSLVALTEIPVNVYAPWRGFQSGTLVDPAHRGHSLGVAIKVANHRQLREHFPDCRVLLTGNADVNAAMNAVNDALGYREVERCLEMQKKI